MNNIKKDRSVAGIVIFSSLLLVLAGFAFFLGHLENISRLRTLLSLFVLFGGAGLTFFTLKFHKPVVYLFFASFLILASLFLFLSAVRIYPLPFSRSWPLIPVFAGLSLVTAGWQRYRTMKLTYVVPALAFIGLGVSLLLFSFDIVPVNFKDFMVTWWPLLVLLAGVLLLLLAFVVEKSGGGDET